uniref:RNA-binding protein NOB1 n=1 Tax=Bursaphelenchus xylophilus TaxID=6326 RepID=A0A1I7S7G4_BURXY
MEYSVKNLVVDSNALIKNALTLKTGENVYSVSGVVKELRDKETKERLRSGLFDLKLLEPSPDSIKKVIDISKKTGDYPVLSLTDINVLALTLDLHIKHNGEGSVNYNVENVKTLIERTVDEEGEELKETKIPGFVSPDSDADDDEDEDGHWLDDSKLIGAFGKQSELMVACMTSDFAMQNVLLHMRLGLLAIDGHRIRGLRTYVLRCRSCYNLLRKMDKEFCPKCGNKNLHRVSVKIDEDGRTEIYLNEQKLQITRGLSHVRRNVRGGKHDNCERIFEDQRMPQNRLAKTHQDGISDSPFTTHDVTSRSAILGIRSQFHSKGDSYNSTNPHGRKSGRRV